ncbi:MAG: polyprenyl synthetase family protein [Bacillota bacterium]|nr:polyprenyl synthetase family protein [Bacillota bacterium]
MMDFDIELAKKQEIINNYLKNALPSDEFPQKKVIEAANYSLLAGGKRIRPVLAMAVCEAGGGDSKAIIPFASAMEMVHTYSLIHDDLPVMDNDDYRRGRLTCHKVYGENIAVLAGDALLNYAFETALNADCDAAKKVKILKIVSHASGVMGMIGGQVIDLEGETRRLNEKELSNMHRLKTGALIRASISMGAVFAGIDEKAYDKFADKLGLAFQIKDDILDETSTTEELGKPVKSDEKNQKSTFISLYGLDKAEKMLNDTTKEALAELKKASGNTEFLQELTLYLLRRTK